MKVGRHSKRTQEEEILRKREDRFEKRGEEWNEKDGGEAR